MEDSRFRSLTHDDFINAHNTTLTIPNESVDDFLNDQDLTMILGSSFAHEKNYLWTKLNGKVIVPFKLPPQVPEGVKAQLARVIDEFDQKTCIR